VDSREEELTVMNSQTASGNGLETDSPGGLRKAAIMMIMLGDKAASEVFRFLSQGDVQRLTAEIAAIEAVEPEEAAKVLEEYNKMALTQEYLSKGGPLYAERLLVKAFGDDEAKRLLEQSLQTQQLEPLDMDTLRQIDPQQLAKMLQDEHPQTIALVLAHLGSRFSSAVLGVVPEAVRAQVVERLAKMRQLSGETVQKFMMVLQKKIGTMGRQQNRLAYGGISAVAGLLNNMDAVASKAILEAIEQNDPKLALSIRDVLFTFEDLLSVPLNSIREILGQVEKKSLAVSLKGASENLRNYIFKAMSQRAVEMLKEDMEALGPMRAREVAKAQHEIVTHLRQMESEGKISLRNEEQDALVV
jgi:flagellar motor switch protein FliG